jgi:hypothetical protein
VPLEDIYHDDEEDEYHRIISLDNPGLEKFNSLQDSVDEEFSNWAINEV